MTAAYRLHRDGAMRDQLRRAARPQPVTTIRVAAVVMAEALRLAGGDARRLDLIDVSTVLVRNQPRGG